MFNMLILQEIYNLQDSIGKISESIETKDSTAVSILADKLTNIAPKPPENVAIETFMAKLIDNPRQALKVLELLDNLPTDQ